MPTAIIIPTLHKPKKSFKWAPQSIASVKSGRVHKRTPSASSASTRASQISKAASLSPSTPEVERLESEIAFTYDTFATITIMLESLRNAYSTCKTEMDLSRSETRLSEKEKELLSAYDDLGLQVVHLERQITKLEDKLGQIRKKSGNSDTISTNPVLVPEPALVKDEQPISVDQTILPSPVSFAAMDMSTVSPAISYANAYSVAPFVAPTVAPCSLPEQPYTDCYFSQQQQPFPAQSFTSFEPAMFIAPEPMLQAYNPTFYFDNEPLLSYPHC